jgi:hypothetical protein
LSPPKRVSAKAEERERAALAAAASLSMDQTLDIAAAHFRVTGKSSAETAGYFLAGPIR